MTREDRTFKETQVAARAAESALNRWRRTLKPAAAREAIQAIEAGLERVNAT